jgi:hypothetical protein
MRIRIAVVLLSLVVIVPALRAQSDPPPTGAVSTKSEETVESTTPDGGTVTTSTTTTSVTEITAPPVVPSWMHLVRIAAKVGPIAFLVLAWAIGGVVHWRLVRREQAQFPTLRGSRAPQTVPMIVSAALFAIPTVLFAIFEARSRLEIQRGIGGVVDEWQPVTAHAWTALVICLALALLPWLFARRADTVA